MLTRARSYSSGRPRACSLNDSSQRRCRTAKRRETLRLLGVLYRHGCPCPTSASSGQCCQPVKPSDQELSLSDITHEDPYAVFRRYCRERALSGGESPRTATTAMDVGEDHRRTPTACIHTTGRTSEHPSGSASQNVCPDRILCPYVAYSGVWSGEAPPRLPGSTALPPPARSIRFIGRRPGTTSHDQSF